MLKKFGSLIVALVLIVAAIPLYGFVFTTRPGGGEEFFHARPNQAQTAFSSRFLEVSNPNFATGAPATFTTNISGWTAHTTSTNAISAVVNLRGFDSFVSSNNLNRLHFMEQAPTNVGRPDDFILALASRNQTAGANIGYTSSDITLTRGSYFIISVDFYAVASISSINLVPTVELDRELRQNLQIPIRQASFGIDNLSSWQTASFFVTTDYLSDITVSLGLFLGEMGGRASGGVVYYDNVRISQVTQDLYQSAWNNTRPALRQELDLRNHVLTEFDMRYYDVTLSNFNPAFSRLTGIEMRNNIRNVEIPGVLGFEDHNQVRVWGHSSHAVHNVMMLSAETGIASMTTRDMNLRDRDGARRDTFTLGKNALYMVSFYSLSSPMAQSSFRIRDERFDWNHVSQHLTLFDSGHMGINESGTVHRNNWALNTFFVTGDVLDDKEVYFEFWIGQEGQAASGWLLIDDFSIVRVSNEYFETHRDADGVQKVERPTHSPTAAIPNAHFNYGTVRSAATPFPLRADSWTLETGDPQHTISGIVNTYPTHWNTHARGGNYGIAINPRGIRGAHPNNNVFMMQHTRATWQRLSAGEFSLPRNEDDRYHILSFEIATVHRPENGMNFFAVLELGGKPISYINLGHERRSGSTPVLTHWRNYSFAIRDSQITSRNVSISFIMGEERPDGRHINAAPAVGFIDNIRLSSSNNRGNADIFVDLSNPAGFRVSAINNQSLFFRPRDARAAVANVFNSRDGINDILRIETNYFRNTVVENTLTEELSSGNFYEYRVEVRILLHEVNNARARRIWQFDDRWNVIDEPDDLDYGVTFRLDGFSGGFENIKPENLVNMSGHDRDWTTLSFFINADSTRDLNLEIEFGNQWRSVWGIVEIRSMSLHQIEQEEWEQARTDAVHGTAILTEREWTPQRPPAQDTTRERSDLNFLIIPSIIMGVTILFAIAAVSFRRIKFRRHIRMRHTSYAADDERSVRE